MIHKFLIGRLSDDVKTGKKNHEYDDNYQDEHEVVDLGDDKKMKKKQKRKNTSLSNSQSAGGKT